MTNLTPEETKLATDMRYNMVSMGEDIAPRLMKRHKLIWYCIHDGQSKWACINIDHDVIGARPVYYSTLKEALLAEKTKPTDPNGYADHISGNWEDVPEWAIERINFLEECAKFNEKSRCPKTKEDCPAHPDLSCSAVKHCYPYLCNGSCGHNEMWVDDDKEKAMIMKYRNYPAKLYR